MFRILLKSRFIQLVFAKANAMAIRSLEIYSETLKYLEKRGALLGLNLLASNFKKINLMSTLVVFNALTYTLVTIICLFEFSQDLERLVFCLVTYGFAVQVLEGRMFQV